MDKWNIVFVSVFSFFPAIIAYLLVLETIKTYESKFNTLASEFRSLLEVMRSKISDLKIIKGDICEIIDGKESREKENYLMEHKKELVSFSSAIKKLEREKKDLEDINLVLKDKIKKICDSVYEISGKEMLDGEEADCLGEAHKVGIVSYK